MKKIFSFFILFLLFKVGNSQINYGIKGNVQFTNVTDIHAESETRKLALAFGGFIQIPLYWDHNESFFFRPEILYSQQGEKDGGVYDQKFFQDYINVPLMLKYYFKDFIFYSRNKCNCEIEPQEFFIEAGPQISYLLFEKEKEIDRIWYVEGPSMIDISFGIGAGISFSKKYEFSVRYNIGLVDAYKNYYGNNRTSNLAFTFSYMFDRLFYN